MHRALVLLLLIAGCADDPMRRIPPSDRALLEAEARLGGGPAAPDGRTTVADVLARARGEAPGGSTLVLSFAGGAVQPDAAQRDQLAAFARRGAGRVVVTGGRGDPALLGERRAVAVARALEADLPEVELRFATGAAPDQVRIAREAGTPLAQPGGR